MINPSPFPQSPFVSPFPQTPQIKVEKPQPREVGMPRYLNYLADLSGCGHWRILWPEQVINATGVGISHSLTAMVSDPRFYKGLKAVKLQRQASSSQLQFLKFLKQIQQEAGFKIIYEVDDVVFKEDIPDYNKFKFAFDTEEIRSNCVEMINMVDEVTVTCPYMRDLYKKRTGQEKISVVPNFVPDFWMGNKFNGRKVVESFDKNKKKPRILYTGSGAHYDVDNKVGGKDDFEGVRDYVRATVDKYQWVFVGAYPPQLADLVTSGKIEFYRWQNLLQYPQFIANLNAQLMVAPLQNNSFNKAKSDIKFIEACTLGIPCLCQDMETYYTAPDSLKFGSVQELSDKVDSILDWKNRTKYYKNVYKLREIGANRILELEPNIGSHLEALNTEFGDPKRKYIPLWQ